MKFLFYKPLRFEHDGNNICFWSDTHFGHRCDHWETPLWKMRGFSSIEEHDNTLVERWNKVCNNETIFFHLGDFIFGQNPEQRLVDFLSRLKFKTLYSMPGNHSSGWKQVFESQPKTTMHLDNKTIYFIPNYLEVVANGQPIVMSHYPLASFNGQAKGSWMLHGHCHSNLYKSEIGSVLYKTKIIDIGVENSPLPKTLNDLTALFQNKQTVTFDHHNEQTLNPF